MANYMFVLRPTTKKHKVVCPACVKRGEVLNSCPECHGSAVKGVSITQYYVQDRPIEITNIDRDPKTGVLRYWEGACDFYYETLYPELNHHVPEVPHGVHLCHDTYLSAKTECERINKYLTKINGFGESEAQNGKFNF
jgi:RecJ-like exonuclease